MKIIFQNSTNHDSYSTTQEVVIQYNLAFDANWDLVNSLLTGLEGLGFSKKELMNAIIHHVKLYELNV